jgi:uncharacterized protein DUF1206
VTAGTQGVARAATGHWPERLARLGLAARGVLYVILGVLALRIAFGERGEQASQSGALQEVASQPFGQVLIWVVAVGLIAYALWRLATAALGTRTDPTAHKGSTRFKALLEGIGYGSVAVLAVRIAAGGSGGSSQGRGGASGWTAEVLDWPAGPLLVGVVGALIVGAGSYLVWEGWRADFTQELKLGEVGPGAGRAVVQLGRVGRIARGASFALIGALFVAAAVTYDPSKAKGLDGALKTLVGEPYGVWLLGAIAVGLIAYGLYGLAESRLRRIG